MKAEKSSRIMKGYLIGASVAVFIAIVIITTLRGDIDDLQTELELKNNVIELLQEDYNKTAKELRDLKFEVSNETQKGE